MNAYLRHRQEMGVWIWRCILGGAQLVLLLGNSGCGYPEILGVRPISRTVRHSVEELPEPDPKSIPAKKRAYPYDLVLLVRPPEGPFSERHKTGYEDATDMGGAHASSRASSLLSYSLAEYLTLTNLFRNVVVEPQNTYFGRIGNPSPAEPDLILTPSFDVFEARVHQVSEGWMTSLGAMEIRTKATIEGEIKGVLSIRTANNTAFLDVPVMLKSGPTTAETKWRISGADDNASKKQAKAGEAHRAHREIVERMVNMLVEALDDKKQDLAALSGPLPSPENQPSSPMTRVVGRRFAVLVGVSRYQNASREFPNLNYADRDARDLASFLASPQGGAIPSGNIKLLVNQEATLQNVRAAFSEFTRQADVNDLVLIYFSGHGIPDPDRADTLYLMCYDSDRKHMPSTALPMNEVQTALQRHIVAQRVVVLADACHSAGIAAEGKRGIDVNRVNRAILDLSQIKPTAAVFTSSEGYELSQESGQWGGGHGVFTWALLEGLQGKADGHFDGKPDGVVTLGEAIEYTRQTVITATKNAQHPAPRGTYDRALPMSLLQPATRPSGK